MSVLEVGVKVLLVEIDVLLREKEEQHIRITKLERQVGVYEGCHTAFAIALEQFECDQVEGFALASLIWAYHACATALREEGEHDD